MTKARGRFGRACRLTLVLGRSGTVSATHSKQIGLESSFLDINKSLLLGRGVGYRLTASDVDGGTAGGSSR
jgi:hypothetical protein